MPKVKTSRRQHYHKHVDKKLRNRLRIYFVISVALIGVVCYEIVIANTTIFVALVSGGIGLLVGVIASRMFHISWDHDMKKVISRLDWFGGVILGFYILSSIFRAQIISRFVGAHSVTAVTITFFAGVMLGRILGTRGKIMKVLKEQEVF